MKIDSSIPAQIVANLQRKAAPMLAACIGGQKTMRIDKQTTIAGVIVAAEIDAIENWGRSARVIFKISMECGANKTIRQFRCQQLPQ